MEIEMFPAEGQIWAGLLQIIPEVTFYALSFMLRGTFQSFLHLAAQWKHLVLALAEAIHTTPLK